MASVYDFYANPSESFMPTSVIGSHFNEDIQLGTEYFPTLATRWTFSLKHNTQTLNHSHHQLLSNNRGFIRCNMDSDGQSIYSDDGFETLAEKSQGPISSSCHSSQHVNSYAALSSAQQGSTWFEVSKQPLNSSCQGGTIISISPTNDAAPTSLSSPTSLSPTSCLLGKRPDTSTCQPACKLGATGSFPYNNCHPQCIHEHCESITPSPSLSTFSSSLSQKPVKQEGEVETLSSASNKDTSTNYRPLGGDRENSPASGVGTANSINLKHKGLPYAQLIYMALMSVPSKKMVLADIYNYFRQEIPRYRKLKSKGWMNSIRHNLSMNGAFLKEQRPPGDPGKGFIWVLSPEAIRDGVKSTTRFRKTPPPKRKTLSAQPKLPSVVPSSSSRKRRNRRWSSTKNRSKRKDSMGMSQHVLENHERGELEDQAYAPHVPLNMDANVHVQVSSSTDAVDVDGTIGDDGDDGDHIDIAPDIDDTPSTITPYFYPPILSSTGFNTFHSSSSSSPSTSSYSPFSSSSYTSQPSLDHYLQDHPHSISTSSISATAAGIVMPSLPIGSTVGITATTRTTAESSTIGTDLFVGSCYDYDYDYDYGFGDGSMTENDSMNCEYSYANDISGTTHHDTGSIVPTMDDFESTTLVDLDSDVTGFHPVEVKGNDDGNELEWNSFTEQFTLITSIKSDEREMDMDTGRGRRLSLEGLCI